MTNNEMKDEEDDWMHGWSRFMNIEQEGEKDVESLRMLSR